MASKATKSAHNKSDSYWNLGRLLSCTGLSLGGHFQEKVWSYSGVLRPGSTGFQDKFQHSYLHYISAQKCATDFQSALKGSSTFWINMAP